MFIYIYVRVCVYEQHALTRIFCLAVFRFYPYLKFSFLNHCCGTTNDVTI